MNYLQNGIPERNRIKGIFDRTSIEISAQPTLWQDCLAKVSSEKLEIKSFVEAVVKNQNLHIILTGAGTSAFIGESLVGTFQHSTSRITSAIPTTDLVTHPSLFLQKDRPTLIISFARSGDSPESLAAVKLADTICSNVYHIIITCNPHGKLGKGAIGENKYLFILPSEANDQALAMTGSYTSMLLVGLLIARIAKLEDVSSQVRSLVGYGMNILRNYSNRLQEIADMDFRRAVFLGSGPLFGTARESHLKLQELTDGKVICKFDSFLGIRHGPKVVIDKGTLLVYLLSNAPYVQRYEIDLIRELSAEGRGLYSIGICEKNHPDYRIDQIIELTKDNDTIDEELLAICAVLPAQILGYYKSVQLDLDPDQPSVSGAISRVVSGVEIHAFDDP